MERNNQEEGMEVSKRNIDKPYHHQYTFLPTQTKSGGKNKKKNDKKKNKKKIKKDTTTTATTATTTASTAATTTANTTASEVVTPPFAPCIVQHSIIFSGRNLQTYGLTSLR
jgi:hypothetical protein